MSDKNFQVTQTFKWITGDTWASSAGPSDTMCSVVTISRFNRVTERNYKEWVYTTKKVVNNKNSNSCKELDEDEHFYDWRGAGAHFVGCDYVEMNSDLVLCGIILEERRCTFRSG